MDPVSNAASVLSGLAKATKLGFEATRAISEADLKMKVLEVVDSLVDARTEILRLDSENVALQEEIDRLKLAFERKDSLELADGAYWVADGESDEGDGPFCIACWEGDHRRSRLLRPLAHAQSHECPSCKVKCAVTRTY